MGTCVEWDTRLPPPRRVGTKAVEASVELCVVLDPCLTTVSLLGDAFRLRQCAFVLPSLLFVVGSNAGLIGFLIRSFDVTSAPLRVTSIYWSESNIASHLASLLTFVRPPHARC